MKGRGRRDLGEKTRMKHERKVRGNKEVIEVKLIKRKKIRKRKIVNDKRNKRFRRKNQEERR